MNIGFVSTWFERGAAYVTKAYMLLLEDSHDTFVYARGGESIGKGDPNWDFPNVTWGRRLKSDTINYPHFLKWVKNNKLDVIFFNEQIDITILQKMKQDYPEVKLGAYIDYYKESTVKEFDIYDFLICNTLRHYSVFKDHKQCYYVPWGTNVDLFKPVPSDRKKISFFHSAGMSLRKGTNYVIEAFIKGEVYKKANLILHTQRDLKESFGYSKDELAEYNIEVIEETVTAPGLYHLGDVYIYPTKLDGLGLTMYEALSCGLSIITTNNAPMNEIVTSENGKLVDVDLMISRADGYYWPLSIINIESLKKAMLYYVNNYDILKKQKIKNREEAIEKWNWDDRKEIINKIFRETDIIVTKDNESLLSDKRKLRLLYKKFKTTNLYFYCFSIINFFKKNKKGHN